MAQRESKQSEQMSRRRFCFAALGATAVLPAAGSFAQAGSSKGKVRFYKNLGPGHIGVKANQQQVLEYAAKFGFDSITPSVGEFADKSPGQIREWVATMKRCGIRYGSAGLPVDFRRDEERFRAGIAKLPGQARLMKQLGVTRVATWILPGHKELTYLRNFKQHERRLREAAQVLKDNDVRLGLEFVGPRTSRARNRLPFICSQHGMMELANAIGTGNVGLLMDSWHWYTSHGTVDELLELSGKDIVHVHVNDAPAGVPVDEQIDNRRRLPVTTGVIDMRGFVNALAKIGYDGPVECEPFDQHLRQMENEAALRETSAALDRLWDLIAT
ncbi:MAG: sugar phosphate isomerase/epimerase family protein [Planctomycetota bacterium]